MSEEPGPDPVGERAADTNPAGEAAAGKGTPAGGPATDTTPAGEPATVSRTAEVTAGPGGVMTDEVGVITGELTLRTELHAGQVVLRVQYKDAEEWYTVTGSRAPLTDPAALDTVLAVAVGILHRPEG